MFAKFVDGKIEFAPINKGDVLNYGNCSSECLKDGYKKFEDSVCPFFGDSTKEASCYYDEDEFSIKKKWSIIDKPKDAIDSTTREKLIMDKIRNIAIEELKKEGKLDESGKLKN